MGVALILLVIILSTLAVELSVKIYIKYANDIRHEGRMLPCPKCGHKAITILYNGENNPPFYTAECGSYERSNNMHHISGTHGSDRYFEGEPEMTEEQKKCKFCAGYGSYVPHFKTRLDAVLWWNRRVHKIMSSSDCHFITRPKRV